MLTRVQICKQYGLSSSTFDDVKPLLTTEPVPKCGNVFYDLSSHDDLVLRCAKNHPASFSVDEKAATHTLPFHRFLALRFLTTSLDDIYDELLHRNLATHRLKKEYLKRLRTTFLHNLPPELRAIAAKQEMPNELQTSRYRLMMQTIGIDLVYEAPMWLEDMFLLVGDPNIKRMVELVLTTRGLKNEHQAALEEMTGVHWKGLGVEMYKSLFYDIFSMSERDWVFYGDFLRPPERNEKLASRTMSTNELRVHTGLRPHFKETTELVLIKMQRRIADMFNLGIEGDTNQLNHALRSYLWAGKNTGEELRAETSPGKIFEELSVASSDKVNMTINDIQEPEVAQVKRA
jgi:hypothetical protein